MKQIILAQGAEGIIVLEKDFIIKDRIPKQYRHPELDKQIIKRRTKAETKLLTKASKIINSPFPEKSTEFNKIKMPFIDGKKLSQHLDNFPLKEQKQILKKIGNAIAKIHKEDIIHGDLTTSNMILIEDLNIQKTLPAGRVGGNKINTQKVFFIDFGLGFISKKTEDKAVDLHLLKQALEAKHFKNWETLLKEAFKEYEKVLGKRESKKIFERITAIERRGRYRH